MAKNTLEYIITSDTKGFTSGIKKADDSLNASNQKVGMLNKAFGALSIGVTAGIAAVAGFFSFIGPAIKEAQEAIKQDILLANALGKVGLKLKDVKRDIESLATNAVVDDDDIKKIYNYGLAWGVPKERLKQFAETALDFSAQTGKGLDMAMRTIKESAIKGGTAFDQLSASVKGASSQTADMDGGFKRLDVTLKGFQEVVGKDFLVDLAPVLKSIVGLLNDVRVAYETVFGTSEQRAKKLTDELQKNNAQLDQYRKRLFNIENAKGIGKFLDNKGQLEVNIAGLRKRNDVINTQLKLLNAGETAQKEVKVQTEAETKAIKEQDIAILELQNSLKQYGEILQKGTVDLEEFQTQTNKLTSATVNVADALKTTFGFDSGLSQTIGTVQKIGQSLDDVFASVKSGKADVSSLANNINLQAFAIEAVANVAIKLWDNYVKGLDNTVSTEAYIEKINIKLKNYADAVEAINKSIQNTDRQIARSQKGAQSSKTVSDQIALTEQKIKDLNEQYKLNGKFIKDNANLSQKDIDQRRKDTEQFLNIFKSEKNNFFFNPLGIFNSLYDQAILNYENILKSLDAEQNLLDNVNNAKDDQLQIDDDLLSAQDDLLQLKKDLLKIDNENIITTEEKKASLAEATGQEEDYNKAVEAQLKAYKEILAVTDDENEQLDLKLKIAQLETRELEKQNNLVDERLNKLKEQIDLGLIDIESYKGVSKIQQELANLGITGTASATQIKGLGARTDIIGRTQIGQITITNNEANLNSIAGSIGTAINSRI